MGTTVIACCHRHNAKNTFCSLLVMLTSVAERRFSIESLHCCARKAEVQYRPAGFATLTLHLICVDEQATCAGHIGTQQAGGLSRTLVHVQGIARLSSMQPFLAGHKRLSWLPMGCLP
jgi:hypothetical protein